MNNYPIPRLDKDREIYQKVLPLCRLRPGEIWNDPIQGHKIGCLDSTKEEHIKKLMNGEKANLAVQDPPYNFLELKKREVEEYISWCKKWVNNSDVSLSNNSSFYAWLGANQKGGFQPLPDFMLMMREFKDFHSRSFITMRNQRGYGTQNNWMALRQECLFYIKGKPNFKAQYTDIPKILRGYYKKVNGKNVENMERSKSKNIRPGNVWVDVQQVFYKMEENVNGCYFQKPLKSIDRLIASSSKESDLVIDFFGHSGTTLLSAERLHRRCFTCDIDPVYCEIMIRRIERFRETGKTGWQNGNPF